MGLHATCYSQLGRVYWRFENQEKVYGNAHEIAHKNALDSFDRAIDLQQKLGAMSRLLSCASSGRSWNQLEGRIFKILSGYLRATSSKYSPLPWDGHFDEAKDIMIPDTQNVFHAYMAGTQGPVVLCLHGGGYFGLSFALVAGKMKHKVRVVALDMRGHGLSRTDNDLSTETLCSDVLSVINTMYGKDPPSIILVGHSMGGAIAVKVAAQKTLRTLAGLVVVDVVEGFVEDQFGLGLVARAAEEGIALLRPNGAMIFNMGGRPGQVVCERLFEQRGFHINKLWQTRVIQVKTIFKFLSDGWDQTRSALDLSFQIEAVADEKIPSKA